MVTSTGLKKNIPKSHNNSRVLFHEDPTKNRPLRGSQTFLQLQKELQTNFKLFIYQFDVNFRDEAIHKKLQKQIFRLRLNFWTKAD